MRIWDVSPKLLCRNHLLGEHRELHALWTIITQNKKGYINHPETKRWIGKTAALFARHELLIAEMKKRGYNHASSLEKRLAKGEKIQTSFVDSISKQKMILKSKPCDCPRD
jgi:hypothetical protein